MHWTINQQRFDQNDLERHDGAIRRCLVSIRTTALFVIFPVMMIMGEPLLLLLFARLDHSSNRSDPSSCVMSSRLSFFFVVVVVDIALVVWLAFQQSHSLASYFVQQHDKSNQIESMNFSLCQNTTFETGFCEFHTLILKISISMKGFGRNGLDVECSPGLSGSYRLCWVVP